MMFLTAVLVTSLLAICQGSSASRRDEINPVPTAEYNPCVEGGPRYYVYASDPHKFIDCGNSMVPYVKTCPVHLIWNPSALYCDYPANMGITSASVVHTTHPPVIVIGPGVSSNHVYATGFAAPCTRERVQRKQLYWPYPGYVQYYIMCDLSGNSLVMACMPNHVYYEVYQTCVSTQTPGGGVTLPAVHVTRSTASSGGGSGPTVSGWSSSLYSTGFTAPCTPEHVKNDELYWPYPDSAHFYIQCDLFGDAYIMACQPGFDYSQVSHTCIVAMNPSFTWSPTASTRAPVGPTIPVGGGGPVVGSVYSVGFNAPCTRDAVSNNQLFWPYPGYSYVYLQCDLAGDAIVQACQAGYIFYEPAHTCINVSPVG